MKKTMDRGLEMARRKTDAKLEKRLVVWTTVWDIALPIAPTIIIHPKIIRTMELSIPNIFLILSCSNNFPIPKVESAI